MASTYDGSRGSGVVVLVAVTILLPVAARADRSEWSAGLELGADVAFLVHPAAERPLSLGMDGGGAVAVVPRVAVPVTFGLTNDWEMGLSVSVGAAADVLARDVVFEGYRADVLTGLYFELSVPVTLAWQLDAGSPVTAGVRVGAGPKVAAFLANRFVESADVGEVRRTLPVKVEDSFVAGGEVVVGVPVVWRALDWLVVEVEPTVGASWAGGFGGRVGFVVRARWCGGAGVL